MESGKFVGVRPQTAAERRQVGQNIGYWVYWKGDCCEYRVVVQKITGFGQHAFGVHAVKDETPPSFLQRALCICLIEVILFLL